MTTEHERLTNQIAAKVEQCILKARAHWPDLSFPMPHFNFKLKGAVAGTAATWSWSLRFNFELYAQNEQQFLRDTVPHEVAHLVTSVVYPEKHDPFSSKKREIHGDKWRSVLSIIGGGRLTRCHSYDVSKVKRTKARYEYECQHCKGIVMLSAVRHGRFQYDEQLYHHKCADGWKGQLVWKNKAPTVTAPAAIAPKTIPYKVPVKLPAEGSKLRHCYDILLKHQYFPRQDVLFMFQQEAGCTPAAASTYYHTCKKLLGD